LTHSRTFTNHWPVVVPLLPEGSISTE
jgi:hypothetical protein